MFWGIVTLGVYFGIIAILAKDAIDQIRSRKDEWKVYRKNNRSKNRKNRV